MKSIMKSGSQRKLEFAGITLLYMVCFTFEQALLRLENIVTKGKKRQERNTQENHFGEGHAEWQQLEDLPRQSTSYYCSF